VAVQKITIVQFLALAKLHPVLDVRSPGEYGHAHIPGAYNLPLFTDEERHIVGTLYKKESREAAIKKGLEFFGVKMRGMVEATETLLDEHAQGRTTQRIVLVHCWRGGMRSAGVAWLLDLYGFTVYTLTGGYKSYREWVRARFEENYSFVVLGGYTGSGKTMVLKELKRLGKLVIDLEKLAGHKGSAFGALGEAPQPSQERFENLLAAELNALREDWQDANHGSEQESSVVYIEDESQRIGTVNLPNELWKNMRTAPLYFIEVPFEERLGFIVDEYGKFPVDDLIEAILRIQKRLGGLETKNAIAHLLDNNVKRMLPDPIKIL
jgi:tRNA 2-selenouridine synthase